VVRATSSRQISLAVRLHQRVQPRQLARVICGLLRPQMAQPALPNSDEEFDSGWSPRLTQAPTYQQHDALEALSNALRIELYPWPIPVV